jgi:hypothetical protein
MRPIQRNRDIRSPFGARRIGVSISPVESVEPAHRVFRHCPERAWLLERAAGARNLNRHRAVAQPLDSTAVPANGNRVVGTGDEQDRRLDPLEDLGREIDPTTARHHSEDAARTP